MKKPTKQRVRRLFDQVARDCMSIKSYAAAERYAKGMLARHPDVFTDVFANGHGYVSLSRCVNAESKSYRDRQTYIVWHE